MNSDNGNLYYGEDSTDYEYAIIGDEEGLKKLRFACDEALKNGEYCGEGLGDFTGVKQVDSEKFKTQAPDDDSSNIVGVIIAIVFLSILAFAVVGVIATVKWIF